jgi:two-component system chemotaxis response regulator CheB
MPQRDIVVVGASAGGVRALRDLAAALPADLPAAVCVVLHVGAYDSTLPALMSAVGPLPAEHAKHHEPIEHGRIYVAPPDHHLLVAEDELVLTRGPKEHHTRPAVDPLFRSAALSCGPRVIGVLLTGGLDDGTAGMQAIRDCGGLTVVQDPADAEDASMPRSALQAIEVDHCLPLAGIAPLLVKLVREPAPACRTPAPRRWVHEQMAAVGDENAMDELRRVGTPSTLSCPDCQGTLWEISGSSPPRYRCHTGHAYSLRSLASAQSQAAEEALWSGVRALQEKEVLLRRIAELDRAAGDEQHALKSEQDADRMAEQALLLRRIVESE